MARKYTRLEQRRYREKRRAQAARVADRLMGRKKKIWDGEHDDLVDASAFAMTTNFYVNKLIAIKA